MNICLNGLNRFSHVPFFQERAKLLVPYEVRKPVIRWQTWSWIITEAHFRSRKDHQELSLKAQGNKSSNESHMM